MFKISRLNKSRLANWWWTVDKVTLSIVLTIIFIGAFLVFSASPSVARTINISDEYHFIKRQIVFIFISIAVIIFFSMQNLKTVRRLAVIGYLGAFALTLATLFMGETKGASRWISIFGISLQPSEFIKPTFVVMSAWLLDGSKKSEDFPGTWLSAALFTITAGVLLLQPDIGMTIVVALIWCFQLFLAGLPLFLLLILAGIGMIGAVSAYFTFDHFHNRINAYMSSIFSSGGELPYQIKKSLKAFENGNLLGKGPGEGVVKNNLPDAHTDFIFAVAGEEFGVVLCTILVVLFSIIVIRSLILSTKENNLFIIFTSAGLAASFGLQGIINMASSTNLGPTKGMTLPFISYGGSSLLASAICI